MPLANEQGFPLFMGWGTIHDGWSSALLGRAGEGLALLTKGFATIRATAEIHCVPWLLVMLAEVHLKLGQTAEGLDSLAEAAQIIERTDERFVEAELHRLRGELLNTTGDQAAAEEKYHQALAVAQRQSAKTLELRAAISLARLWIDQGKRSEARDLLASVYFWFTEGFDTPVLQEAKALLDQVTGAEHGPPLARSGQAE
jgi:predicted ATPase